ncbi:MAG: hypothetical protein ACK53X_08750 [Holosporales bacterium]
MQSQVTSFGKTLCQSLIGSPFHYLLDALTYEQLVTKPESELSLNERSEISFILQKAANDQNLAMEIADVDLHL